MKIIACISDHVFEGEVIDAPFCPICSGELYVSELEIAIVGTSGIYPYRLTGCAECSKYYYFALPAEQLNEEENRS